MTSEDRHKACWSRLLCPCPVPLLVGEVPLPLRVPELWRRVAMVGTVDWGVIRELRALTDPLLRQSTPTQE
jgi:hypothetical protein